MPRTNSSWASEALAVFQKEWMAEMRSRHGLYTSSMFSLLAVVAMSFASFAVKPPPSLAAGMLCVTLLFSSVVALPRTFLSEDEQGTFDLLRLAAEPSAAFAGKMLYNIVQSVISVAILTTLFVTITGLDVGQPLIFVTGCLFTALTLASGVSLCGAIVIGASNRWLLGSAAALPVLLPQIFLGMGALRVSFGQGTVTGGWMCVLGLFGWALALGSAGPLIAAAAWRTDFSAAHKGPRANADSGQNDFKA